jgi:hypothetical protein
MPEENRRTFSELEGTVEELNQVLAMLENGNGGKK